ncbi:MAG TPA: GAF domain-containing protein, partial [Candidatus Limnocylindria bacterium]|nr:GAF domain-containing protein [Candidatus Limnocylindria bacterium]
MSLLHRDRATEHEPLLSVAQAAALLGVHPNTIRVWTEAGRLAAYRINARGDRRYRRSDVEALLAEGADNGEGAADATEPAGRDAEMAVLVRLAQGTGASTTVAAVCRSAIEAIRANLAVPRVAIYLRRDGSSAALLETHAGYRVSPPEELTDGRAADDVTDPLREVVSLRSGGEELGALFLEDEPGGPLSRVRTAFLRVVASAVAADIQQARALARARREVTRARALRHVTQELTGQLDLNAVLDDIVDRTRSLFDAEQAGLWLLDESDRPFRPAAIRGLSDEFNEAVGQLTLEADSIGVRAVRERRSLVARDADRRPGIGVLQELYRAQDIRTACLVPLVSNDRAVGLLGLYHTRDREWPDEELALVQSFANQAAVAIANARLYRSVAEQAARMRSIQDLSARLNRLTDVQAIADAIVAEASTLAAYHDIRVYVVDWEAGYCEPIAFTDRLLGEGDFREALRVTIGEGSFTGWVAEHGEPILANDALGDPRGMTIEGTDDIEESMLVVPMLFEGRSVGVITLSKLGTNQFSNDDLQTMTIFAGYAAQAIANARAYERLELQSAELARQLQSQRRLLEINERLLSTLDAGDVLNTIADGLQAVVHYDNLSIYRVDDANRLLHPVLTREQHAEEVARYVVPFGRGLMGWAVEHAEPVLANDALGDPRAMQIPGTPADPEALVVVPLIAEGEVIGCMNISRVGGEDAHFSAADFELVKLFAGQASIALRNAEEHQAMTLRADTDALTGVGNHGAFQRHLAELLARAEADPDSTRPVALLMMDLDSFKSYNDRLGHPAGDALLHAIATAIYGAARSEDRVYRYGGDEFVLVLPGVNAKDAASVGDRIRGAVARLTARQRDRVTISVGVAAYPADATDKNGLIAAADAALYVGKQSGGDRVVRAADVGGAAAGAASGEPEAPDTLRDALLSVARSMDAADPATIGHADRVGLLARRLAEELGAGDETMGSIELAARLHGLDVPDAQALASVPSLGTVGSILGWRGDEAAAASKRSASEPSGVGGVPIGTQILAVANAYDRMTTTGPPAKRGRRAVLERLRAASGERWSTEVVEALARVVAVGPRRAQRRRSADRRARRAPPVNGRKKRGPSAA